MKKIMMTLGIVFVAQSVSVSAASKGEIAEAVVKIVNGSEACNPLTGCPKKYSSAEVHGVTGAAIDTSRHNAESGARQRAAALALQNAKAQAIAALPACDAGCESGEVESSGYGTGVSVTVSGAACDDETSWLSACIQETHNEHYCLMELDFLRRSLGVYSQFFAIASASAWARASRSCEPAEGSDKVSCQPKSSVREIVEE